ncbi:MAG: hypothetical protein ACYC1D_07110 [Acidimicrobiales bacterium]
MRANRGLAVIAVDPAYTSRWGAEHWLDALRDFSPDAIRCPCGAVVGGRQARARTASTATGKV